MVGDKADYKVCLRFIALNRTSVHTCIRHENFSHWVFAFLAFVKDQLIDIDHILAVPLGSAAFPLVRPQVFRAGHCVIGRTLWQENVKQFIQAKRAMGSTHQQRLIFGLSLII